MVDPDELFEAATSLYVEKGLKFTMDELSRKLGISKRTLYETVSSKEQLGLFVIDRYFDNVAERQEPVRTDPSLDPVERLRKVLTVTPDLPRAALNLNEFRSSYPEAFALLDERLSHGWERTLSIIDEGVEQGVMRPINKDLFAHAYTGAVEELVTEAAQFEDTNFEELQAQLVDLLIDGITAS